MPVTPDQITALNLPDEEKEVLFDLLDGDIAKFDAWQAEALRGFIEQLAQARASAAASAAVRGEVESVKQQMPSLFQDRDA